MNVVNFSNLEFHQIPMQDNPAFGDDECLMIVKEVASTGRFVILHIIPENKPLENDTVNSICIVFKEENALMIADLIAKNIK